LALTDVLWGLAR